MKKRNRLAEYARVLYLGSIAVLLLAGFGMDWLVKGYELGHALCAELLPALPAVLVYALARGRRLPERSPGLLKNKDYLPVAVTIALVCWGALDCGQVYDRNLYWSAGYLLCCYVTYVTLAEAPGVRCAVFLVQTLLFGYLSIYHNVYAGGSIAIGVLSAFLLLPMAAGEKEDPLSLPAAAAALVCMVLWALVPVLERLLFSAISQETAMVLDAFRDLLPNVRALGKTALPFADYESLRSGHQLGYLLARLGWVAAIPVALAAAGMVTGGFVLAAKGSWIPAFGCQMLLVLRLVSALLYLPGLVMGLGSEVPFLGGGFLQRMVDLLLCAMVLLPVEEKAGRREPARAEAVTKLCLEDMEENPSLFLPEDEDWMEQQFALLRRELLQETEEP